MCVCVCVCQTVEMYYLLYLAISKLCKCNFTPKINENKKLLPTEYLMKLHKKILNICIISCDFGLCFGHFDEVFQWNYCTKITTLFNSIRSHFQNKIKTIKNKRRSS